MLFVFWLGFHRPDNNPLWAGCGNDQGKQEVTVLVTQMSATVVYSVLGHMLHDTVSAGLHNKWITSLATSLPSYQYAPYIIKLQSSNKYKKAQLTQRERATAVHV